MTATEENMLRLMDYCDRLRAALPDPDKLETLAAWFDSQQAKRDDWKESGTDLQDDLRRWAKAARNALAGRTLLEVSDAAIR
jgi:hypothetical protein